eukprot:CAMPEP_0202476456 /NCGR_PEP_ID=MMETSP1360-20130828/93434_1 /ASSEMBLY_ACC=CAM_ASM_000848 /TAXON_ID=515479 /ORGANISM="Licmophora paradoxa, Strain CCMP2313" /LENGTH=62 /DNA_ID=CAMNT_0049103665 /DNA_START=979 /DNA_END=1164 /DNA_ORIENTATION=+
MTKKTTKKKQHKMEDLCCGGYDTDRTIGLASSNRDDDEENDEEETAQDGRPLLINQSALVVW